MTYNWLPPKLAEIADVAGLDAALALAKARGGSRISIPARPSADHWIVKTVGAEAAEALCSYYRTGEGGTKGAIFELPVGPSGTAAALRARIDELLSQGVSADKIAVEVGVHRTTVFRRLSRAKRTPDPNQANLFD